MFQPIVSGPGLAGWRFLQRTYDQQFEAFTKSTQLQRDTEYFRENIGAVKTAEDLVSDRRLLNVALGAFGLQADIDNKFFIRKILDEGTADDTALANRFSDSRYAEMSQAFGFGPQEFLKTGVPVFAETIIDRFEATEFEVAAGNQDEALRLALYTERKLGQLAGEESSVNAKWFTIMGEPPLRQVFEKALNLPTSFGRIDIDQQLEIFKDRAGDVFGTEDPSIFTDEDQIQDLITKFVVRKQLDGVNAAMSSGNVALTLLSS